MLRLMAKSFFSLSSFPLCWFALPNSTKDKFVDDMVMVLEPMFKDYRLFCIARSGSEERCGRSDVPLNWKSFSESKMTSDDLKALLISRLRILWNAGACIGSTGVVCNLNDPMGILTSKTTDKIWLNLSEIATSESAMKDISDALGLPQESESETEFICRAKVIFKKILRKALAKK